MVIEHLQKHPVTVLVVVFTIIRLLIANLINLGNDEVYYFTYAVLPDWNHFDHPPLVGIFIRLFTFNLHCNAEVFVRMPGIVAAAINTWLIARLGASIKNRNTGLIAAILYNSSVYTSILSGIFILPDSVQLTFWLAALYTMLHCIKATALTDIRRYLLLTGLFIGLATMSKVHGVFLWFGFLGFIVSDRRGLLKSPYLYLAIGLTVLLASPILFWNIGNDFITWRFHSERVTVSDSGMNIKSFFRTTIGQVLYANPFQIVLFILTGKTIARRLSIHTATAVDATSAALLLWCSLPIIVCTTLISLFRDTLPHWSGPGFLGLMLLGAAWTDQFISPNRHNLPKKLLLASAGLILFVFTAGPLLIRCYPGTMSSKPSPHTGAGDATLDITGWEQLLPAFEKLRNDDIAAGKMAPDAPMVVHKWFPGSHIYYHVAYPLGMRTVGVGKLEDLHQFAWLNRIYGQVAAGSDAWYISPSNNFSDPAELYEGQFERFEKAGTITQRRNGKIARYWFVYRLRNARQ
ncbi:Dolichyl-phosphate-mannose-protein mannosyltransferase [Dyadobacter sp. SG02]|uniref:ArnT family glycosyltransferase n=1 Tax=Dyadobacter sp. SG02 TaxID=1855291 RepID=UPI0008C06503|nr:glycosyltransferase family 39 protein [Dyadobacter sp. SG02]SEJ00939.1 Dolichyl-phosphate-mannose-protein mannosyltransferase [Dyadobacter sp. SG02]